MLELFKNFMKTLSDLEKREALFIDWDTPLSSEYWDRYYRETSTQL